MIRCQFVHQAVQLARLLLILRDPCLVQHLQKPSEIRLPPHLRKLIPDVIHDRLQIQFLRVFPERIGRGGVLRRRVVDQVRDQLDDIRVGAKIGKRIESVRSLHVDKVQGLYLIAVLPQKVPICPEQLPLWRVFVKTKIVRSCQLAIGTASHE